MERDTQGWLVLGLIVLSLIGWYFIRESSDMLESGVFVSTYDREGRYLQTFYPPFAMFDGEVAASAEIEVVATTRSDENMDFQLTDVTASHQLIVDAFTSILNTNRLDIPKDSAGIWTSNRISLDDLPEGTHWVTVTVLGTTRDPIAPQSDVEVITYTFTLAPSISIQYSVVSAVNLGADGWNLIGVPGGYRITDLFQTPWIREVWVYTKTSGEEGVWEYCSLEGSCPNPNRVVSNVDGVWIWDTESELFRLDGYVMTENVPLYTGWNLIAVPFDAGECIPLQTAIQTVWPTINPRIYTIYKWDAVAYRQWVETGTGNMWQVYIRDIGGDLTELCAGEGYWLWLEPPSGEPLLPTSIPSPGFSIFRRKHMPPTPPT